MITVSLIQQIDNANVVPSTQPGLGHTEPFLSLVPVITTGPFSPGSVTLVSSFSSGPTEIKIDPNEFVSFPFNEYSSEKKLTLSRRKRDLYLWPLPNVQDISATLSFIHTREITKVLVMSVADRHGYDSEKR